MVCITHSYSYPGIHQLIELEKIKPGTSKIRVNVKDGLDGAGNQMAIKGDYSSMVTMGFVVLDVWDTTDPDPVSTAAGGSPFNIHDPFVSIIHFQ